MIVRSPRIHVKYSILSYLGLNKYVIMRDSMLIIHFIGLAMGLGTSFGYLFLGMHAAKLPPEERGKFMINTFVLTRMGHIGLTLLVISGGALMTPYWKTLGDMPLMIAKLFLVLVLAALIGISSSQARKVKAGDMERLKRLPVIGRFSLLTALAIVVLAVLVFH